MPEGKDCAVDLTVGVIGGRWKVLILQSLFRGTQRFSELQREIDGITSKMLTQQLRDLERDGILTRTVHPEVPPRVEYTLTERGRTLWPVLQAMHAWGVTQQHHHDTPPTTTD
jgi:DNA-binding HxlR family transcriptional regulator